MWSSQHYITEGLAKGLDRDLLATAARQIEDFVFEHRVPALLTLNHLSYRTGINYRWLRSVVERSAEPESVYRHFRIQKRSGGLRTISIPCPELMSAQRWIATYVLRGADVHHSSHAFRPGDSIVKCARRHTGARWLVKMDVADFFGSITEIQVFRAFRSLGYSPLVAFELARLCTFAPMTSAKYKLAAWKAFSSSKIEPYRSGVLGRLPQGAPTSPMLSNLAMKETDEQLAALARQRGMTYTRYSDDLTFSTRDLDFDRRTATSLISDVSNRLKAKGLFPKRSKTVIVPPGARKVVLGLIVDSEYPRLSREFKDRLRQHFYYLEKFGPEQHANVREWESIGGLFRHLRGLIDFAKMVEPMYAEDMLHRLMKMKWPGMSQNRREALLAER